METKHIYIPLTREYKSNRRLSETLIKKRLERAGWTVWRGGFLHACRSEQYPNVEKKYRVLERLLGERLEVLQYFSHCQHGMPDYFCHRKGEFKFVECKLGHEQLSSLQKKCIARLQALGFAVEVHKIVFSETKTREAIVDLYTNEKQVLSRQLTIKQATRKRGK